MCSAINGAGQLGGSLMGFEHDFGMDIYPKVTRKIFEDFHE
jgi:hypothetical protein